MRRNRRRNKRRRGVNYKEASETKQGRRLIKQRNVNEEKEREDKKAE